MYIADVGQNAWEEVDFQPADSNGGENYGWNIMEGAHCYGSPGCDQTGLVMPVAEYNHNLGCSVTGIGSYRGPDYPALDGIYFFGEYCTGRIWGLQNLGGGNWAYPILLDTPYSISGGGKDADGNVYFTAFSAGGSLWKIVDGNL